MPEPLRPEAEATATSQPGRFGGPEPTETTAPAWRRHLVALWLIAPVLALAWHFGPGQRALQRDRAADQRARALAAAAGGDWGTALTAQHAAQVALAAAEAPAPGAPPAPAGTPPSPAMTALLLDRARAQIASGALDEALPALTDLLARSGGDGALAAAVRHELASASYHAAWAMRLEGAAPEEWGIEAEAARQHFRLLAEQGGAGAEAAARNLEATVRLQRMDLGELKALPLPKDCQGCKSLSQRRRQQRESDSRKPASGKESRKEPQDVRQQIKQEQRGAGADRQGGS